MGSDKRTHSGKLSFCTGVDSVPLALYGLQLCGRTIKFMNSPPCACRDSTGQKP